MSEPEGMARFSTALPAESGADLDATLAFLRRPASYPDATPDVEVIETHMSWVFLTDRFVYKLKKPVRLPFLDFSTVERRKHFCEEEVRLNRRLAPQVYLGTVAITREADGALLLGGSATVVDWLVKMRRLPADRMLDQAIRRGGVAEREIEQVGMTLAAFYRAAAPLPISPAEYRLRFEKDVADNLAALREAGRVLPQGEIGRLHRTQLAFLRRSPSPVEQRAADGRIVEAHGDLRPEHICLGPEPQIIDCLEFNFEFRCLDPADELAFLAMECDMLDAPRIGTAILDCYRRATGDRPPQPLIDFYKCYRACLRAKLAIWHLRDPNVREPQRWPKRARAYLALAGAFADRLPAD